LLMGDHLPPSEEGEIWKDVPGYEGSYMVSNRGRVWSVARRNSRGARIGGKLLAASYQESQAAMQLALDRSA
jgi:NUMOD4 motif